MDIKGVLEDIMKTYHMLEDEKSRFIYVNRLDYLLTGEIQYIEKMVRRFLPGVPVYDKTKGLSYLIANLPRDKQVVIYGAGHDAEQIFPHLSKINNLFGFCDRNKERQNAGFHGYKVISPDRLLNLKDVCVIVCSRQYGGEIKEYLLANGINEKDIYDIRQYRTTCLENTYFEDFLSYSDHEVFIDAGCNDLATTVQLTEICPGLKKVYGFEPDPENFKKCKDKWRRECAQLPEVILYPQGLWSENTKLRFDAFASVGSRINENGTSIVDVVTIDDMIGNDDTVTFIKMDIEGAELEALRGAANIIRRDKPKCAISIYHKMEDMITIPLYIKELVPEYKLYIRHYSNSEYETVLYAVL